MQDLEQEFVLCLMSLNTGIFCVTYVNYLISSLCQGGGDCFCISSLLKLPVFWLSVRIDAAVSTPESLIPLWMTQWELAFKVLQNRRFSLGFFFFFKCCLWTLDVRVCNLFSVYVPILSCYVHSDWSHFFLHLYTVESWESEKLR